VRKKPVDRIHEHVLPHQRRDRRHHEEGRDHEDTDDALAPHRLIEQIASSDAEDDGDDRTPPTMISVVDRLGQNELDETKRT
jgi:hypothetical protein